MKYRIILLFLVLCNLSIGQERIITARVIEAQNSLPIPSAKAEVRGSSVSSISNFLGYFQITANVGDTLIISHPSYVFSRVIIPDAESFQITLEPKYIELKYLSLNSYPLDSNTTESLIPEFVSDAEGIATYSSNWDGFYTELGNAIHNHPSFSKFKEQFEYKIQFTVTNKGSIDNVKLLTKESTSSFEYEVFSSSLKSLKPWTPAFSNNLPISQHFELSISNGNELFTIVEQAAAPPGGYQAFYNYVGQALKYPELARKKGIEGKVYIQFVVDTDGSITEVEAVKRIGGGCDEEAVRVVKTAPKWSPPMQRGKPVKQRIIMPITFSLGTHVKSTPPTFYEHISWSLRYPKDGRTMGVEGTMYAIFEVNELSSIENISFFKSLGPSFEKEIYAAILLVPPGAIAERLEVAKQYILPFSFVLGSQMKSPKAVDLPDGIKLSEIVVTAVGVDRSPPGTTMRWVPPGGRYESIEDVADRNPNIEKISLINKNIHTISSKIGKLQQLIFLDLEGNSLSQLPKEISSLKKLKELYVPSNKLVALPNNFGALSNLKVLGLASNNLNEFPLQITQLTKLEILELSSNNITSIPSEITNLKKLKVLFLNDNNIEKLPEEIFTLNKLEKLYLVGTKISPQDQKRLKEHFNKTEVRFD
ncbi:TonB family protein [Fulvivirga sp.]|uniref:TonB family protein n=1 Tax=Fulvivirga sp. TaxID=1931237 RepID=UPI0032F03E84